jgi:hypothetical protein
MRTSWMSRRTAPATRNRRVEPGTPERRAATAWLLAGLVLGLVLWLSGCGAGGGSESATGPSTERSGTRPAPSVTATAPTRPTRTSAERPTSPPTAPKTSDEAQTQASTPTPSAAGTPAAAESQGLGTLGWTLLILLVVALAAGWLIWRSRRKSAWASQAEALEANTRGATSTQLPAVLTAETAGQRALSWPPLRAALVDLIGRWDLLAEHAPDDQRQNRAVQIRSLLQELLAAVDAENQALAAERDWRLLRPRVDQAGQALFAVLAGLGQQEPSAGAEPWQPTPGG